MNCLQAQSVNPYVWAKKPLAFFKKGIYNNFEHMLKKEVCDGEEALLRHRRAEAAV